MIKKNIILIISIISVLSTVACVQTVKRDTPTLASEAMYLNVKDLNYD